MNNHMAVHMLQHREHGIGTVEVEYLSSLKTYTFKTRTPDAHKKGDILVVRDKNGCSIVTVVANHSVPEFMERKMGWVVTCLREGIEQVTQIEQAEQEAVFELGRRQYMKEFEEELKALNVKGVVVLPTTAQEKEEEEEEETQQEFQDDVNVN